MKKVLLVNDSKFESIIMKDILNSMGYDVKVSDEFNATGVIENFHPDFLVVNYIMKEIRGDQLIAMVKLHNPGIKCFLCSSSSLDTMQNKKIDGFIKTPVEKDEIAKIFNYFQSSNNDDYEIVKKKDIEARVGEIMHCRGCGREIGKGGTSGFAFCPYCGGKN
ncbi:MAG: response regulator [Clostridia bacterium]|nr:response regulator [Clostridia bacterium]